IPSKDRSKGENAIRTVLVFGADRAYDAVPALIKELKRHRSFVQVDVSIRVNATMSLGAILGSTTKADTAVVKDAVSVLNQMLGDSQFIVKYRAAEALGKIGAAADNPTTIQ